MSGLIDIMKCGWSSLLLKITINPRGHDSNKSDGPSAFIEPCINQRETL